MSHLPLEALWVWVLLGVGVAGGAWWKSVRPGSNDNGGFAGAVGVVIILVLFIFFHGNGNGYLPLRF